MERFANWSELPAKKQEVLERKLFYGKEMMMVRNEVNRSSLCLSREASPAYHAARSAPSLRHAA